MYFSIRCGLCGLWTLNAFVLNRKICSQQTQNIHTDQRGMHEGRIILETTWRDDFIIWKRIFFHVWNSIRDTYIEYDRPMCCNGEDDRDFETLRVPILESKINN